MYIIILIRAWFIIVFVYSQFFLKKKWKNTIKIDESAKRRPDIYIDESTRSVYRSVINPNWQSVPFSERRDERPQMRLLARTLKDVSYSWIC